MTEQPSIVDVIERTAPTLSALIAPLTEAAMQGRYELLVSQIEQALQQLYPGAQVQLLQRAAGTWRLWTSPDEVDETAPLMLPDLMHDWTLPCEFAPRRLYVPFMPGALGALVEHVAAALAPTDALEVLRQHVVLALKTCERQRAARRGLTGVQVVQRVAERILKCHDLDEILLHITQETKHLLSADICGVLLNEGNEIAMRRCDGNLSPETARLRMRAGQGLAGLVLSSRAPAVVEDYVNSGSISRDFFHLAEAEAVRSALAAPLLGSEQIIGVLEVWRRRPSTFTDDDSARLVALADLASIAIGNAELYASQQRSVDQLAKANEALNRRYDTVEDLFRLTQHLMQLLLSGCGLDAIAAGAGSDLGVEVLILDLDGSVRARARAGVTDSAEPDMLRAALLELENCTDGQNLTLGGSAWRAQPMVVDGNIVAWVLGAISSRRPDLVPLALVQVAVVGALHRLEQRAASRARWETIDAIIWDLLQSEVPTRAAAIDRAIDVGLDLSGLLRLFLVELGPAAEVESEPQHKEMRRQVLEAIGEPLPRGIRAVALRGLSLVIVHADGALVDVERLAVQMVNRLLDRLSGRTVQLGGSGCCPSVQRLHVAFREAQIALDVARQMQRSGAMVYDRAGVLGLLLGLRHEAGMRRFLALSLGRLLDQDEKAREELLQTLRVFFDVNCSLKIAAERLGVHRKTIANRLAKIAELTELDFTTHDDRLVADIALHVQRLLSSDLTAG